MCPIEHPKNDVIIILANRFGRVKAIMILVIALRSLGILGDLMEMIDVIIVWAIKKIPSTFKSQPYLPCTYVWYP